MVRKIPNFNKKVIKKFTSDKNIRMDFNLKILTSTEMIIFTYISRFFNDFL